MLDIAGRNDDALAPGETGNLAGIEEAFNLLVDPADRLDPAELVDGSGDSEGLLARHLGECRQQREQFGCRGAIAIDPAIGLFEDKTGVE